MSTSVSFISLYNMRFAIYFSNFRIPSEKYFLLLLLEMYKSQKGVFLNHKLRYVTCVLLYCYSFIPHKKSKHLQKYVLELFLLLPSYLS